MKRERPRKNNHSQNPAPQSDSRKDQPSQPAKKPPADISALLAQAKTLSSKEYEERNKVLMSYQASIASGAPSVALELLRIIFEKLHDILTTNEDCMYMARYLVVLYDRGLRKGTYITKSVNRG